MVDPNEADPSKVDAVPFRHEPTRILLFVVESGTIPARLTEAIRHEFPWLVVKFRADSQGACTELEHPVALVLFDMLLIGDAEDVAQKILRAHPHAIAAAIEYHESRPAGSLRELLESPLIRGVLPMNLRLDTWLSVIKLMLCGGEYFPAHMLRASIKDRDTAAGAAAVPKAAAREIKAELTARELQILEMVSTGLQNKSIAGAFGLSEHTVKIHLHNIMSKLGAHNRTEAAALFQAQMSADRLRPA